MHHVLYRGETLQGSVHVMTIRIVLMVELALEDNVAEATSTWNVSVVSVKLVSPDSVRVRRMQTVLGTVVTQVAEPVRLLVILACRVTEIVVQFRASMEGVESDRIAHPFKV